MKISLKVNEHKQLDIDLNNPTELEKISIMSNVFQLMGINNKLSEMIDDFIKIGNAYKKFYNNIDNIEPSNREPMDLELRYDEEKEDNILTEDSPDHYKSGIILETDGTKKYKCRLHCECNNNQNVYIEPNEKNVECPNCNKNHKVRNAKEQGFPIRDSWGNYFIAGGFIGEDE